MKNKLALLVFALIILCPVFGIAVEEAASAEEALTSAVAYLADLLDRATYVAVSGFTLYDSRDQAIAAQQLLNLFVGPAGKGYVAQSGGDLEPGELGILDAYEEVAERLGGEIRNASSEEYYVYVDVLRFAQHFLRLAYSAAEEAVDVSYSLIGPEDALREAYAFLVAVRGGFSDPFLLSGIGNLASMLGVSGADSSVGSLQAAIDALPSGGTLILEPGIYRERLVLTRDITLRGASAADGETILEGPSWYPVIRIAAAEPVAVTIENVTIKGGFGGIVHASFDDTAAAFRLSLRSVRFAEGGTALTLGHGASAQLRDCAFEGNQGAIVARSDAALSLNRCVISGCRSGMAAVMLWDGVEFSMTECELSDSLGKAILALPGVSMHLTNNVIEGNYSHAIAIASYGFPEDEDDVGCGVFVGGQVQQDLPPGEITGHGNTIRGAVCPESLAFLKEPFPTEVTVGPGESIRAAVDAVVEGGTVLIPEGTYRESLEIDKPVTLAGEGGVILKPDSQDDPAVRVSGAAAVEIRNLAIEAASGIEIRTASCRLIDCSFRTTDVGVSVTAFGSDTVELERCGFTGEGVGVKLLGDGSVGIDDCRFSGLSAGAVVGGTISATIRASSFEGCCEGLVLASSASATIEENRIHGSLRNGIRVSEAPSGSPTGSLVLNGNSFANSGEWDVTLCGTADPAALAFHGSLFGTGNVVEGGSERLCPSDYDWPDGFIAE